jgi:hypothetical protein
VSDSRECDGCGILESSYGIEFEYYELEGLEEVLCPACLSLRYRSEVESEGI